MADEAQTFRNFQWREWFPFTHIFRTFRIAIHPSKLALGLAALLCLYAGGRILDSIWPARQAGVVVRGRGLRPAFVAPGVITGNSPDDLDRMDRPMSEVEAYEVYHRYRGAADDRSDFEAYRKSERLTMEREYAQLLQQMQIETDPGRAADAASDGKHLSRVKNVILGQRQATLDAAKKRYDEQIKAADDTYAQEVKDNVGDERGRKERREQAKHGAGRALSDAQNMADADAKRAYAGVAPIAGQGLFGQFFGYEISQVNAVAAGVFHWDWLGESGVVRSVWNFLTVGPGWLIRHHPLYFILLAALFLLVWSVFGGAIARIAAVHAARDEKISVRQALRFSTGKLLSFIFAPLIPLLIILVAGVALGIGGLLLHIPYLGPIIMALLFALALLVGFVMTLVALGTVGGFNLMYPTVAVEGTDSFDAISRSFSYVFARPWRMLFYTVVAVAYGALTYLFVRYFIYIMLALTHWFVGWFLGGQPAHYWPIIWPPPSAYSLPYDLNLIPLKWSEATAAVIVSFWVYLVIGLLGAYAISFYFSANTIIYYLMRREVDATEMDEVYVEDADDEFAETPVTGSAATATDEGAAPATGTTSAPGGGVSGSAGSGEPGGGEVRSYNAPQTDAPPSGSESASPGSSASDPATDTGGGAATGDTSST